MQVPSIQQSAALALGRLANYSDDLAEAVVGNEILPQLVYSLSEQNRWDGTYKVNNISVTRSNPRGDSTRTITCWTGCDSSFAAVLRGLQQPEVINFTACHSSFLPSTMSGSRSRQLERPYIKRFPHTSLAITASSSVVLIWSLEGLMVLAPCFS